LNVPVLEINNQPLTTDWLVYHGFVNDFMVKYNVRTYIPKKTFMLKPKSICLYCGSSANTRKTHQAAATEFGTLLAAHGISLVFGGGRSGLMGLAADAALKGGSEVIGVIPTFLMERDVGHTECTSLHTTHTMHERKQRLAELSDAFVILPGGLGTLDEAFEIITWKQLSLHDKPIVIANIDGYWNALNTLLKQMTAEKYIPRGHDKLVHSVSTVGDILPTIVAILSARFNLPTK
jgi:uncharacterized protein (TIGR00730 family)